MGGGVDPPQLVVVPAQVGLRRVPLGDGVEPLGTEGARFDVVRECQGGERPHVAAVVGEPRHEPVGEVESPPGVELVRPVRRDVVAHRVALGGVGGRQQLEQFVECGVQLVAGGHLLPGSHRRSLGSERGSSALGIDVYASRFT